MSSNQPQARPAGSTLNAEDRGPASTNGTDPARDSDAAETLSPDATTTASDLPSQVSNPDGGEDDIAAFLASLARAMQTSAVAEHARLSESAEQRRQAHIQGLGSREATEAEQLRELAERDISGVDMWAEGEIARIRLQREERIAARRAQLQSRLEEHHSKIEREIQVVEAAVSAYRADVDRFFGGLEAEKDPIALAQQARERPAFPPLDRIGSDDKPGALFARVVGDAADAKASRQEAKDASEKDASGKDASGSADGTATVSDQDIPMIGVMAPPATDAAAEMPWKAEDAVSKEPALEVSAEAKPSDASQEAVETRTGAGAASGDNPSNLLRAARADRLLGTLLGRGPSSSDRSDSDS
jgi:hypothetical protein